jgi:hypothetical protein
MGKRNYRTVVAAILMGAVLFSPLLRGMTFMQARAEKASATLESVPGMGELVGEFFQSGAIGCMVTHIILRADVNQLLEFARVGNWVWVGFGVETVRFIGGRLWR